MATLGKRFMLPSPTGQKTQSRCITLRSEWVLVKPMYRVANSRKEGEAGPGSKREASYGESSKCG